jgi:hypothetical protein
VTAVIVMARVLSDGSLPRAWKQSKSWHSLGLTKFEKRMNRAHPAKKHVIRWTVPELRDGLVRLVE